MPPRTRASRKDKEASISKTKNPGESSQAVVSKKMVLKNAGSKTPTAKPPALDCSKDDSDESDLDDDVQKIESGSLLNRHKRKRPCADTRGVGKQRKRPARKTRDGKMVTAWDHLRDELEAEREKFNAKNEKARKNKVNTWDAGQLQKVYEDALERYKNHEPLITPDECFKQFNDRKAVILRERVAIGGDEVFLELEGDLHGATLASLNPAYAEPRIEYNTDDFNYRVQMRWNAWVQEGYPEKVPFMAIRQDKEVQQGYAMEDLVDLTDEESETEAKVHPLGHTRQFGRSQAAHAKLTHSPSGAHNLNGSESGTLSQSQTRYTRNRAESTIKRDPKETIGMLMNYLQDKRPAFQLTHTSQTLQHSNFSMRQQPRARFPPRPPRGVFGGVASQSSSLKATDFQDRPV